MAEDDDARARESAATQSRFREANERLRWIAPGHGFKAEDRAPFICECADPDCFETVMLSLEEYDRVRAHPSWLLLAAGHEDDEEAHERVIEAERGYAIVERVDERTREAAWPRRRDDSRSG